MKCRYSALAVAMLWAAVGMAGPKPTPGTIISMQSVDCGTKKESKKKSSVLLCQQYVVRTSSTEYQIRQQKSAQQPILAANTPIQFTLDKDKMKFKANGKNYEFLVVGVSAFTSQ